MKRVATCAIVAVVMTMAAQNNSVMADDQVPADSRATTSELPEALLAIGVDSERILTESEATAVRGEGLGLFAGLKASVGVSANARTGLCAPCLGNIGVNANVRVRARVGLGIGLH